MLNDITKDNKETDNSWNPIYLARWSIYTLALAMLLAAIIVNNRKATEKKIENKVRINTTDSKINTLLENEKFSNIRDDLIVNLVQINDDINGTVTDVDYLKKRDEILRMIHSKLSVQTNLKKPFINALWEKFFPLLNAEVTTLYYIRIHLLLKNDTFAEVASTIKSKFDEIDKVELPSEIGDTAKNIEYRKYLYKSIQEMLISQQGGSPAAIKKHWDEYKVVSSLPTNSAVTGPEVAEFELLFGRD